MCLEFCRMDFISANHEPISVTSRRLRCQSEAEVGVSCLTLRSEARWFAEDYC